jgi:Concanavalin A-like lectin/glucanases superfamily
LAKRSELERQLAVRREQAHELIAVWIGQRTSAAVPVSAEGLAVRLRFDEQNRSTFADSAPGASQKQVSATGAPVVWGEGTWLWPYMRMEISTKLELPKVGEVEPNQPFSVGAWVRPHLRSLEAKDEEKPAGIILSAGDSGQKQRGWQLRVSKGKLEFVLAHEMPDNAIQVATKQKILTVGRWNHLLATYDGSSKAAGVALYSMDERRSWCDKVSAK